LATLPWGVAWLGMALWPRKHAPLRQRVAAAARDPAQTYLLAWALATPAFFTLSGNILWTYVLPALPPVALATGLLASRWQGVRPQRLAAAAMLLTPAAALALGVLAWAEPTRYKTEKQLVQQADAMRGDDPFYFVGSRPFSARYYSRGAVGLVEFPALNDVLPKAGDTVYLAVAKNRANEFLASWPGVVTPLYVSRRYALLKVEGAPR